MPTFPNSPKPQLSRCFFVQTQIARNKFLAELGRRPTESEYMLSFKAFVWGMSIGQQAYHKYGVDRCAVTRSLADIMGSTKPEDRRFEVVPTFWRDDSGRVRSFGVFYVKDTLTGRNIHRNASGKFEFGNG